MKLARHIALVGARASGKTSVAEALAAKLGAPWVDLDDLVWRMAGASEFADVGDVLATVGEPAFRTLEAGALEAALGRTAPHVIATGGGVVLSSTNRELLKAHADVVWLEADVATLAARMRRDATSRPALLGRDPVGEIAEVLAAREALYREVARVIVDAGRGSIQEVAERALAALDLGKEADAELERRGELP